MVIESYKNRTFKNLMKLKNRKFRTQNDVFLAEGKKQTGGISKNWIIKQIIISNDYEHIKYLKNIKNIIVLSKNLFTKLADTKSPQGIIAVVEKKHYKIEKLIKQHGFFIILENIQDPGNLGTIIRSADAFGVKAVFVSTGSTDVYSDKTIRSTTGSFFNIPVVDNVNIKEL
ncbi:MAG: hypothetical protein LBL71_00555, partial [Endomicrobium sp.]|nr:hypothetical protein [Endomicrobium sp.]